MTPTQYFVAAPRFTGTWDDYLMLAVIVIALILGVLLFIERPRHRPDVHSPKMAWLRATIYFCFVVLLSGITGVFKTLVQAPLASREQLQNGGWLALTGLCVALVVWGYVIWWPRGTLTHGRRRYFAPALLFGLLWGSCAGLFFLSAYAVIEQYQFPRLINALAVLVIVAIYNINYQSGWWDIHVSPPHNIRAWNNRKVLFAHNPFLIATLTYLVLYGNAAIFVMLNAAALGASAVAMRFPPFWESDGPPVSLDTAIGE